MTDVFINYRSTDYALGAEVIQLFLEQRLGAQRIFLDRVSMTPSVHYPTTIARALDRAKVLVAVIGPRWLSRTAGPAGFRPIDRERDWVRREIRRALQRGIPIVPVLWTPKQQSEPTKMPEPADLPADIRFLTQLQAFEVNEARLKEDLERLYKVLLELPALHTAASRQILRRRLWLGIVAATPIMLAIIAGIWLASIGTHTPGSGPFISPSSNAGTSPTSLTITSPSLEPASPRWTGDVALQAGGIDLDRKPPLKDPSTGDLLKTEFNEIAAGAGAAVIAWDGAERPTKGECSAHVAGALSDVPVFDSPQGSYLCVRTDEGRIASIQYKGITDNGYFAFAVTVWEQ